MNAKKYDHFNDQWVELRYLLNILPILPSEWENKYKDKDLIEIEDNEYCYFLKIKEIHKEQTVAPLDFIKKDIIKLNKGKRYGSALISGRVEQIHAMVKITVRAKGKKQQTIKGLRIICHWVFKVNFITVPYKSNGAY